MENLSQIKSFKSFQVSKQSMNQVTGGRSKSFEKEEGTGICLKVIDQGGTIKKKHKERFNRHCW
ncbi:hypothetical protein [Tenacibaculum sp. Ill]|uniref:hypothetical protein n=1 Tax=Tenacibaculum sp. Ill TaxID=3445935 RepID=UPI003F78BE6C